MVSRAFPPDGAEAAMSQINYTDTKHWLRTARTLTDALPYMQKYAGQRFVIKFGGHAMVDTELSRVFARGHRPAAPGRHPADRGAWRRPADQRAC